MAMPRMSCPVLCPNPHSAPSRDAFTVLRPIVKGVSACSQKRKTLTLTGEACFAGSCCSA